MKNSYRTIKKNLFLTGTSGTGKSTLILHKLKSFLSCAAGFATVRCIDENGDTIAFQHVPACRYTTTQKPYTSFEENCFIDFSKHIKTIETFHSYSCPLLVASDAQKWILMDEIGGYELKDKKIQNAYLNALNSDLPCIGVIKWIGPDSHLRSKSHKSEYVQSWEQFIQEFLMTDTVVLHVDDVSIQEAENVIHEWIQYNLKGD